MGQKSCLLVNAQIMWHGPLRRIEHKEGQRYWGGVAALPRHLPQQTGGIATLRDVDIVAGRIRKRSTLMRRVITGNPMFRLPQEGRSFHSPYHRDVKKLEQEKSQIRPITCK